MTVHLPASLADSWRAAGRRTGESTVLVASITAETTVYEPIDPADGVTALDGGTIPVRSLFAVDLSITPPLSSLGVAPASVLSQAAPKARSQFVETLEAEGLSVAEPRDTIQFEATNGEAGVWFVHDVGYPVGDDGRDAGETEPGPARLEAEAHVAVWPLESTFGMAGGLLPRSSDGIDRPLDVAPERDRETVAELIRSLEFDDGTTASTEPTN